MVMDVLGIALAFSSIMLFFSIIVTAFSHAIQATFNLRYHNLKKGLLQLTQSVKGIDKTAYEDGLDELLSYGLTHKIKGLKRFTNIHRTHISTDELADYLKEKVDKDIDNVIDSAKVTFSRVEEYMSKRFQRIIHNLSIALGLALAFCFQLNTFDLMREISMDEKLRENYIQMLEVTEAEYKQSMQFSSYADIAKASLEQLVSNHKDLSPVLKPIIEKTTSPDQAVESLKANIKDNTIIEEYKALVKENLDHEYKKSKQTLSLLSSKSSMYNFKFWPHGIDYYLGSIASFSNFIGTFISGILISLGAPFWFNAIQNIASLRDKATQKQNS